VDISLTISPVRDRSGAVIGISKIARDITARKRLEQALHETVQARRQELEQALRAEHRVAAALQDALVPAVPQISGIAIDGVYRPAALDARVGGDWYDVIQMPDGGVVLTIGDVAGRGLDAAIIMGEMRNAMRTAALAGQDGANVLRIADAVLRAANGGMATAAVVTLNAARSHFTYAAAGHPPAILATDHALDLLECGTIALGFGAAMPLAPEPMPLPADALLVLYTDGLIEFGGDIVRGQAALQAAATEVVALRLGKPAHAIVERITGGRAARDDIAVLTVKIEPRTGR
jgi:serine phosphatase RsbU (regulator of sigma subunit)